MKRHPAEMDPAAAGAFAGSAIAVEIDGVGPRFRHRQVGRLVPVSQSADKNNTCGFGRPACRPVDRRGLSTMGTQALKCGN